VLQRELDSEATKISTLENFVEYYLPIKVQAHISEIIGEVLSGE